MPVGAAIEGIIKIITAIVGYLAVRGIDKIVAKWVAYFVIGWELGASESGKQALRDALANIQANASDKYKQWQDWRASVKNGSKTTGV